MPEAGFARAVGHKPSARITASFGKAANTYDPAAIIQAMTAATLVDQADKEILQPAKILDIGCGTGLVLEHAKKRWPEAHMTGLDASEDMLRKAAQKVAGLDCIHADAADFTAPSTYDIIFSNMMLHWLQSPLNALQQWQNALKPLGRLYIATLAEGSFHEWAQLCHDHHVADNLWPLPTANFAGGSIQLDEKNNYLFVSI